MKYALRYVSRNKFHYLQNVGAYEYEDQGSYIVMHMTDRLSEAALYDTAEIAKEVSEIECAHYDPTDQFFDLLGVIRISEKQLFKIRLKDI